MGWSATCRESRTARTLARRAIAAALAALPFASCWWEGVIAPANSSLLFRVRGRPNDPGIELVAFVQDLSPPYNRIDAAVPMGGEYLFSGLGAGFSLDVGLASPVAHGCAVKLLRLTGVMAPGGLTRTLETTSGSADTITADVICRSGIIELTVSGLPAGTSATVDFISPAVIPELESHTTIRLTNGVHHVGVFPDAALEIAPFTVLDAESQVYEAPRQGTAVASRDTTRISLVYSPSLPAGDFSLSLAPSPLVVAPGTTTRTTLTVTRSGQTGDIMLDLPSPPSGISAAFSPALVPAGQTTSLVDVTVAANATHTVHDLIVRGTAGTRSRTATLPVDVRPPSFTMTAHRTSLTVSRGDTGSVDLALVRNATATGPIALAHSTLPAGVTASYDTPSPTGGSARLTFTVQPSAVPAAIPVTVTATLGSVVESVVVTLTIPALANDFSIAVGPGITVAQGLTGTIPVALTRTGTFAASELRLTATAPTLQGQAWVAPGLTSGNQAQLELATTANTPPGSHTITVRATANSGADVRTATVDVTVQPRTSADFSIVPAQKEISVVSGLVGLVDLAVYRFDGFAGTITFSASGAPPGSTPVFLPGTADSNPVTAARLTLYLAQGGAPGTHVITIEGSAPGGIVRRTAVTLIVTPAP
jgi:hypothetical protein